MLPRVRWSLSLALVGLGLAAGCADPEVGIPSKAEVLDGKQDGAGWCRLLGAGAGCDLCEELGWYGDGDCDHLLTDVGTCRRRDPDCAPPGCFETHLIDAIALNQERTPHYAAASGGRSQAISSRLISSERTLLPVARRFDASAAAWQRAGIGVMCDEFVPMDRAPSFVDRVAPPTSPFVSRSGVAIAARLTAKLTLGGHPALRAAIEAELADLAATPQYHCMLRHVLESTRRAIDQGAAHELAAERLGLPSPHSLSRDFILAQLAGIALATGLDRAAAPVQAAGIPIVCRDVPPID